MNNPDPLETKLKDLYRRHESLSEEILNLLEREKEAIYAEDPVRIEAYSLFERDLIKKYSGLRKTISSYEESRRGTLNLLQKERNSAAVNEDIIRTKIHENILSLRKASEHTAREIKFLFRFPGYRPGFASGPAPQFIDVSL